MRFRVRASGKNRTKNRSRRSDHAFITDFAAWFRNKTHGTHPGLAVSRSAPMAGSPQAATGVKKLNYEGKPAGTGFITPLVVHNDTIYIAGQGGPFA